MKVRLICPGYVKRDGTKAPCGAVVAERQLSEAEEHIYRFEGILEPTSPCLCKDCLCKQMVELRPEETD